MTIYQKGPPLEDSGVPTSLEAALVVCHMAPPQEATCQRITIVKRLENHSLILSIHSPRISPIPTPPSPQPPYVCALGSNRHTLKRKWGHDLKRLLLSGTYYYFRSSVQDCSYLFPERFSFVRLGRRLRATASLQMHTSPTCTPVAIYEAKMKD